MLDRPKQTGKSAGPVRPAWRAPPFPKAQTNPSLTIVGDSQGQQAIGRPQDSHTHIGSVLYGALRVLCGPGFLSSSSDPGQVSEVWGIGPPLCR